MQRNPELLAARLQKVLDDYQLLANSNPQQLRLLLPASEVWRLFVDGRKQAENIKLDDYINMTVLRHPLGRQMQRYTLTEFATCKAARPAWGEVVRYLHLSEQEMNQITIAELMKFNKGWFLIERSESGYLRGLYSAFQYAFSRRKKFDLNFIRHLHRRAAAGVSKTNYALEEGCARAGEIRIRRSVGFPLNIHSSSPGGLHEILQEDGEDNYFLVDGVRICAKTLPDLRIRHAELDLMHTKESQLWIELAESRDLQEVADALFAHVKRNQVGKGKLLLISEQGKSSHDELIYKAELRLAEFNEHMLACHSPLEKLNAIVWIIKKLERLHVFDDLNCRSLCMASLVHLLVNHGFPLGIQFDPNIFDAKKQEEILEAVIESMENTFILLREQQLYGIKTENMLNLLQTPNALGASRAYFDQITEMEERARRHVYTSLFAATKRKRHHNETIEDEPAGKKVKKNPTPVKTS